MITKEDIYRIGDRVCDCFNKYGWGIVYNIDLYTTSTHPNSVKFDDSIQTYTRDGRYTLTDELSVLSFTEYDLVNGGFSQVRPQPEIAVDTPIFVRRREGSNWYLRYFSHFNTDGQAVSFKGQLKSTETKYTSTWDEYSLTNPLI